MGGQGFKGGVVHFGAVVGLVGDGPQDHKGDGVAVGGLGDGRALHLGTHGPGLFNDKGLLFPVSDELVAAGHPAQLGVARVDGFRRPEGVGHQTLVRGENKGIEPRNLPVGVAEGDAVKIVIHGILTHKQIPNVQVAAQ